MFGDGSFLCSFRGTKRTVPFVPQPVRKINKKTKKIFAILFGGKEWKHYLCIRFPKGTAPKGDL